MVKTHIETAKSPTRKRIESLSGEIPQALLIGTICAIFAENTRSNENSASYALWLYAALYILYPNYLMYAQKYYENSDSRRMKKRTKTFKQ